MEYASKKRLKGKKKMATALVMIIFVIPIMVGIFMLRRSRKVAISLISIPFIFMVIVAGWWVYEANYRFISSTDLAGEQLDNIELRENLSESFKDDHGDYSTEDNVRFREYLEFESFSVGVGFFL